jgi:hypothetical protein
MIQARVGLQRIQAFIEADQNETTALLPPPGSAAAGADANGTPAQISKQVGRSEIQGANHSISRSLSVGGRLPPPCAFGSSITAHVPVALRALLRKPCSVGASLNLRAALHWPQVARDLAAAALLHRDTGATPPAPDAASKLSGLSATAVAAALGAMPLAVDVRGGAFAWQPAGQTALADVHLQVCARPSPGPGPDCTAYSLSAAVLLPALWLACCSLSLSCLSLSSDSTRLSNPQHPGM